MVSLVLPWIVYVLPFIELLKLLDYMLYSPLMSFPSAIPG